MNNRDSGRKLPGNVLLVAGPPADLSQTLAYLAHSGIETAANPDLYVRAYRQFGVDDAQELRGRASSRAIGDRRVFVIAASSITAEAQNALLKTLEEPPDDALFVFLVPAPEALLATVRSRAQIVRLPGQGGDGKAAALDASSFLAARPAIRMDMLKAVLEKDADDKYDTGAILAFLAALERSAGEAADSSGRRDALAAIYRARMYATDRGASIKALLESVALLAPSI